MSSQLEGSGWRQGDNRALHSPGPTFEPQDRLVLQASTSTAVEFPDHHQGDPGGPQHCEVQVSLHHWTLY